MSTVIQAGNATNGGASISSDTAGSIQIQTGSTPTTALTIDTSQNVGIGTSSPSGALDVRGSTFFGSTSGAYTGTFRGTANWNYGGLNIIRNASNTSTPRLLSLMLDGDDSASTTIGAYNAIWGSYNASPTTGSTSSSLQGAMVYGAYYGHQWVVNGSEKMRIDASGNLLVNTTSVIASGLISASYNTTTQNGMSLYAQVTSAATAISFRNGNGGVGSVVTNGTATAYNTSSDYRLKENVQPMQGALVKVAALKPVTYTWKTDGTAGQGFIAHELQAVVPDCVTGTKDQVDAEGNPVYQGVDTSFLVATLTAAVQEQQALITTMQATITQQAADIAALKAKVGI